MENDFIITNTMTRLNHILFVLLFFFVSASMARQTTARELVWPSPPQQARIKHIQTISSIKDISEEPGFFSKVFSFLFGSKNIDRWLVQPVGIAVDRDGKLYIADPGINGIHILDIKKKDYRFLAETKFGAFKSPVGLAFSRDGTLYLSDSERGEIFVLAGNEDVLFSIKNNIVRPTGLSIIGERLYVTDTGKNKVVVFDLTGNFLFEFGQRGNGEGEFNFPVQLTFNNSLSVVDAMNFRIQQFTPDGKYVSSFGQIGSSAGSFANPKSVARDSDGHLYVTDALLDNFQIFNNDGQLLLVVGSKGNADGEFTSPSGIAIDESDNVYVVDSLNKRIQIFKYLK